jgi:lipopolysaccharide heptosyltransferase II
LSRPLEARTIDELEAGGHVLVSRLQYLGDVILTLPMVQLLRERFPRARIDYLARGSAADILVGEPLFDRVFSISDGSLRSTWRLIRELRARNYSLAIDLYSNPRSAIATRLSGARMRVGGSRRGRQRLYTHPVTVPADERAAPQFHIAHLGPLGITGQASKPSLTISNDENQEALSALTELGVDVGKPVIGVHPGGKWVVKRWPVDQFASLAERLIVAYGMQVLVMHGPGEEMYRDELQGRLGSRALYSPTLPIRRTAAAINALDAMVVSDGGIMHVAVAVGTPTVGIFGSAEPDVWFPYEDYGPYVAAWVPITCRPCHVHECSHISCLRNLSPAMVEEKLLGVLASHPRARSTGPVGR